MCRLTLVSDVSIVSKSVQVSIDTGVKVSSRSSRMSSRCGVMRMAPDWGSSSQTNAGTVDWPALAVRAAQSSWPEGWYLNWPACTSSSGPAPCS